MLPHTSTAPAIAAQRSAFADYFRCPEHLAPCAPGDLGGAEGYFTLDGAICYGRLAGAVPAPYVTERLPEAAGAVTNEHGRVVLPFDLGEVVTSFQQERYRPNAPRYLDTLIGSELPRRLYYFLRPGLSVPLRRHLQKMRFNGWQRLAFPRWPVDPTVEDLLRTVMARVAAQQPGARVPFIWFWPDGVPGCALVTHDVEGPAGEAFCDRLMDLDEGYGIKSAFQIVPQVPSRSTEPLRRRIRARGFEVNLHDLNHDGHLFSSREQFLERAVEINRYAREFQSGGFRSGAMYREQAWFGAFEFEYDMSVPNVAHLEPQRGGCCTVMPYFIGDLLEMPLTTTQDYTLFHILSDYSTALWKQQSELILAQHGLISVITHPDYLLGAREQLVYRELLTYLSDLRDRTGLWITLPAQLNRWWRDRHQMRLVPAGASWRIEGPGAERACLAWATLENGRVTYTVDEQG